MIGAGLSSGLTTGYLSIDRLDLELKMKYGTEKEKRNANKIFPVIEDHHALLVTLVLANATFMEALPLYLDEIVPSAYALLISVVAVLFVGEMIPQAICTGTHQLTIAANLAPLAKIFKIFFMIVAYPLARLLDIILGKHSTKRYSKQELKALLDLHSYHHSDPDDESYMTTTLDMIVEKDLELEVGLEKEGSDSSITTSTTSSSTSSGTVSQTIPHETIHKNACVFPLPNTTHIRSSKTMVCTDPLAAPSDGNRPLRCTNLDLEAGGATP